MYLIYVLTKKDYQISITRATIKRTDNHHFTILFANILNFKNK